MRATVLVRPKHGILDPQGQAVSGSLQQLGFPVSEARVGRVIDLDLSDSDRDQARAQVERMCEQLLANPLIESYEIELRGVSSPQPRIGVLRFPGALRRSRRALGTRRARRGSRLRLAHRDGAGQPRCGRVARRLLER